MDTQQKTALWLRPVGRDVPPEELFGEGASIFETYWQLTTGN